MNSWGARISSYKLERNLPCFVVHSNIFTKYFLSVLCYIKLLVLSPTAFVVSDCYVVVSDCYSVVTGIQVKV